MADTTADAPKRILLIEDNPGDARLVQELLAGAPPPRIDVKHADHLAAGLEAIREGTPDLILLDLELPDSAGLDTVTRVHAAAPRIPIVVLTSLGDQSSGEEAVARGAHEYVVKGEIPGPALVRLLRHALVRDRQRRSRTGKARRPTGEFDLLMRSARAVLAHKEFLEAADAMLHYCEDLTAPPPATPPSPAPLATAVASPGPQITGHGWCSTAYEIDISADAWGTVVRAGCAGMGCRETPLKGQRCHAALYHRQAPCPACPVRLGDQEWPRTSVFRSEEEPGTFLLLTAELVDETTARVTTRSLNEAARSALLQAKLSDLATEAKLSQRERMVLHYLVMGRSLGDIATILGISARTVKFHQANILEKLGADSRVDLMRLVF